ncbi:unnamed protein product [Mytilus coruscus]|uniref:RING-type E3 ubiquitin transferase n=1 Tax=Mytilus coruscus TaxID=42192 RepID=A0A6J8EF47_MYTCO|nr:unnamed protein product [Mytilus coruscus]
MSTQLGSLQISQTVISSILSTYTSDFVCFGKIQYSGKDTIYCSYHTTNRGHKFFIFRLLKKSIKLLQELDIECTDFALGSKDEIYYAQFRGSELKAVSTGGVTSTVLRTPPMIILARHINKDKEIILGLREQGSPFPVTQFCTRQIAVFDENNKRKLTFEYNQDGEKLFSYVWRIATDLDNKIYAIDHINEREDGRIVSVKPWGSLNLIYKGHSSVNTSQTPFNPVDIVITETNVIIVSDENNHSLHALNAKGEMIGLQTVTGLGVKHPCSLCLNSEGFLLIGCNRIRRAKNAKIHVAKITL